MVLLQFIHISNFQRLMTRMLCIIFILISMTLINVWISSTVLNSTSIQISRKSHSGYSKFRCTGDENNVGKWTDRLCVFNNICYNLRKEHFEYYRRLTNPKFPLFYDSKRGMLTNFGDRFVSLTSRGGESWSPLIVDEPCPSTNVTWLTNLHTHWREYFSGDSNFGHLVWEDMGSISYSLDRMNEQDDQLVIMHTNQISNQTDFQKILDSILVVLTKSKLVEYESYLRTFQSNHVCFRRFIVGGIINLISAGGVKENDGKEPLLYKWRSKIISYHKFDPKYVPSHHRFLITNKSASVWAKAASGIHRSIANLDEVVTFVRKTYPKVSVDVIEWHKISFAKQIELLISTTILISPAGGVSMIAPFLPHGSHAILMDYFVSLNQFGFEQGSSASMEGMLLNHFPHFKKDYYQIYGADDYVFDFPGATDTRNDASIRINMTRLHLLIESALYDMSI